MKRQLEVDDDQPARKSYHRFVESYRYSLLCDFAHRLFAMTRLHEIAMMQASQGGLTANSVGRVVLS